MSTPRLAESGSPGLPKAIASVHTASIPLLVPYLCKLVPLVSRSQVQVVLLDAQNRYSSPLFLFHFFASYSSLLKAESRHSPLAFSVSILTLARHGAFWASRAVCPVASTHFYYASGACCAVDSLSSRLPYVSTFCSGAVALWSGRRSFLVPSTRHGLPLPVVRPAGRTHKRVLSLHSLFYRIYIPLLCSVGRYLRVQWLLLHPAPSLSPIPCEACLKAVSQSTSAPHRVQPQVLL